MTETWSPPAADDPAADAAQAWFLRLQSGEATDGEVAALRAWLAADGHNQTAFDQVRRVWHGVSSLRETSAPVAANDAHRPRRRVIGVAGSIAAAAVAGVLIWPQLTMARADARTAPGEVREIVLPDGGKAWLDTDSAIDLAYGEDRRQVVLLRGQAWFDVADEGRPFVVKSRDSTITDIGTVFGVRRDPDATRVFVREGEVRIACGPDQAAVLPGRKAACSATGLSETGAADIEAADSWQAGRLIFADRPLVEVLQEIDRYAPGIQFVSLPEDLRARRVTAFLELDRLDAGLRALAVSEGLTIGKAGPVTLIRKK